MISCTSFIKSYGIIVVFTIYAIPLIIKVIYSNSVNFNTKIVNQLSPRIIGGKNAPNGTFPYIVSIRSQEFHNLHICGGSIISERWILTAAHCLIHPSLKKIFRPSTIKIVAGTKYPDSGGVSYQADHIQPHHDYDEFFIRNDIGLIHVDENIEFEYFRIQPVKLINHNVLPTTPVISPGWGQTNAVPLPANELKYIHRIVISDRVCAKYMSVNQESHICTFTQFGKGTCFGDSGSPLVELNIVVGIASFVTPCAVGDPDVYTRVSNYYNWINETMNSYKHDK